MAEIAKRKRTGKHKFKLPNQSWTIKEKLDLVNALCADRHFSHGEARAAVTMVLYFHNTANGHLFPSRAQVCEQCGVNKDVVIAATRKMQRLGYLHYEQSSGGRNERNTYHLKKLAPKVVELHPETVGKSDSLNINTVGKSDTGSPEIRHAGVGKSDTHIPFEDTTVIREEGEASPLPCNSRASAPPEEKRKEEGIQGERVVISLPLPQSPEPPDSPLSKEERLRRVAQADELIRQLKEGSAR
jgi:hypothetical protein